MFILCEKRSIAMVQKITAKTLGAIRRAVLVERGQSSCSNLDLLHNRINSFILP